MQDLLQYEWMRSKKFLFVMIGTLVLGLGICTIYLLNSDFYKELWSEIGLIFILGSYVIQLERRSKLMVSDFIAENSEHMLTIPKNMNQIISMHYLYIVIESFILSGSTALFTSIAFNFNIQDTIKTFFYLLICSMMIYSINTVIIVFLKKNIESNMINLILRALIWMGILILLASLIRFLPLYDVVSSITPIKNWEAVLITCLALTALVGYILNCKIINGIKEEHKSYRKIGFIIFATILLVCITVQFLTYFLRQVDDTNIPFETDQEVMGQWTTVDFVNNIDDFDPQKESINSLPFKGLLIKENGLTDNYNWKWSKGYIINTAMHTSSTYSIQRIDGISYLFMQWKSGDYVYSHMEPHYYVLIKLNTAE